MSKVIVRRIETYIFDEKTWADMGQLEGANYQGVSEYFIDIVNDNPTLDWDSIDYEVEINE